MAVSSLYVINLLTDIAKEHVNEDLRVTISGSSHGAVKVGASALVSSLILGPVGFIIGGVGGGIWAYATSSDFEPLASVIADMTEEERERMVAVARDVAHERGIELALDNLVTGSPEARLLLLEVMRRVGVGVKTSSE